MFKKLYPWAYAESVFHVDYQKLYDKGYRGILFDIDNTLAHHGDDATNEVDELFRAIHRIGLKTLLLTNNGEKRVKRFLQNIDAPYICNADKPKTGSYEKAVEVLGIQKRRGRLHRRSDVCGHLRSQQKRHRQHFGSLYHPARGNEDRQKTVCGKMDPVLLQKEQEIPGSPGRHLKRGGLKDDEERKTTVLRH